MVEKDTLYEGTHCWQHDIRLKNKSKDLKALPFSKEEISALPVSKFEFRIAGKSSFDKVRRFIEKYEWLGRMSQYPTHLFTARYKDVLGGVVIMDMPTTFSKLVGENTRKMERLISRGACASWTPKNLASSLIMWSIKWMVKNTRYRIFSAYADPEARELGTIYQACNFYYLGQRFGSKTKYENEDGRIVSDRYFRSRSVYKRLAKKMRIHWSRSWQKGDRIIWDNIPDDIESRLRNASKEYLQSCKKIKCPKKHKYVYVCGRTKGETRRLRKIFEKENKIFDYPKIRYGGDKDDDT